MTDSSALAAQIIPMYKRHARAWTALRGQVLYEKNWLDRLLRYLPAQAKILDLGCGSGRPIAAYLLQHGHQLTGVDSSDTMLEMAREHFPSQCWIEADMRSVELSQHFDAILAWDSFFHLTPQDQRGMFAQFAKWSKPNAVLMFTSGPAAGEAIGEMFGEALYHASLSQDEYRQLFAQHGFKVLDMQAEDQDCAGHTVWLAQRF
ncbi:class I SAM-dependent methyltransferase [Acinetobacter towneri]|uniref:class I SAM-dependent DNA methyltransferase n=1 Tax=Acinetobacter towneri TaxID=202956 RepID=UPI00188A44C1|nr:class I SAM-dependent methyltransferase [Acinetobacter towneri]MBF4520189.1 class I SAM-dependent methyltransferase [Acinetobacter towneri]